MECGVYVYPVSYSWPACAELDFYDVFCGLAVSVNKMKFIVHNDINRLIDELKPESNRLLCSNTVIGTLNVDWRAVTFGTARRRLG